MTLGASVPIITAGTKLTVSGVVSNHKAGESVAIYYRPYPQPNLIQRATILTSDGGNYSFIVAPGILTTYEALVEGRVLDPGDRSGAAEPVARPEQRLDRARVGCRTRSRAARCRSSA